MNSLSFIVAFASDGFWPAIGSILLYLLFFMGPSAAILTIVHKLLSLPLRRRQRAELFLDLVETALEEGKPLEPTIISASASRDPSPGVRFHLLAAHLETGLRLGEALERVPRLLPPQLVAMLKAGERIGDLRKVMPACRQLLNDGLSQTRGALNYLLILAFVVTPFTILVPMMLNVVVLPKFKEVFWSMANGESLPQFTTFVLNYNFIILLFQSMVMLLVWLALVAYVGGPRFTGWMRTAFPGVPDRIFFLLPWRRKRLQRDFSSMLAILLDSGVPEADAVALAAESTTNRVLHHRAADVCGNLSRGMKLPEAIRAMDDSGELRWRLTNALQHGRDFVRALAGWHEALDAKAFQQEQAAAQFTTTALVLFNGVIVASIVAAVFLALTNLMMEVALW